MCGSADFRLSAALSNLCNGTRFYAMDESEKFYTAALAPAPHVARNVFFNTFWSTIHKDPLRAPLVVAQLARGDCPWSMHKLQLDQLPRVYAAARHCM